MKRFLNHLLWGCLVIIPLLLLLALILLRPCASCSLGTERVLTGEENTGTDSADSLADHTTAANPSQGSLDMSEGSAAAAPSLPPLEDSASHEGSIPESSSVRLLFAGDILFTEVPLSRYRLDGVSSFASEDLLEEFQQADIFMLNEEFPFSTRGTAAPDKQYTFQVDPAYVSIFQELSVDVVTVANNHALDFGTEAFLDTLDTLDQAGILKAGGGRNLQEASSPVIVETDGMRIALFGASRVIPVSSWNAGQNSPGMLTAYDSSLLEQQIRSVRADCDYIVAYLHWGVEKDVYPQDYQRELARRLIDAGADAVIGAHPHVVQGFEFYQGKPIVYSLGNFLFSNSSNDTFLLQIDISTDAPASLSVLPCERIDGQMRLMADPQSYYEYLSSISYGVSVVPNTEGAGALTNSGVE